MHHVHHKLSKDYQGVTVESLRSASGTDSWHHRNGYQHAPKAIEGFRQGEDGYPSNGRIAWALWGGDAGKSWAEGKAKRMDKIDETGRAAPDALNLGDFVQWDSSGGTARGQIEHIMREGINLSTADALIMLNIDFSAVSYWQARARMQNKDREEASKVYWLFAEGGIEEKIYKAVKDKKDYTLSYFKNDYGIE